MKKFCAESVGNNELEQKNYSGQVAARVIGVINRLNED